MQVFTRCDHYCKGSKCCSELPMRRRHVDCNRLGQTSSRSAGTGREPYSLFTGNNQSPVWPTEAPDSTTNARSKMIKQRERQAAQVAQGNMTQLSRIVYQAGCPDHPIAGGDPISTSHACSQNEGGVRGFSGLIIFVSYLSRQCRKMSKYIAP